MQIYIFIGHSVKNTFSLKVILKFYKQVYIFIYVYLLHHAISSLINWLIHIILVNKLYFQKGNKIGSFAD